MNGLAFPTWWMCVAALASPPSRAADPVPPTKEQLERALVARLEWVGRPVLNSWECPGLHVSFENVHPDTAFFMVKPGDGSMDGRREPTFRLEVEQQSVDGEWTAGPGQFTGGCGVYDANWLDEIIELKPGQRAEVGEWTYYPFGQWQRAGPHRVRLHYEFDARPAYASFGSDLNIGFGPMTGYPAFTILSEYVEFEVRFPLTISIAWNGAAADLTPLSLLHHMSVRLQCEPDATAPLGLRIPEDDALTMQLRYRQAGSDFASAYLTARIGNKAGASSIAPGERLSLEAMEVLHTEGLESLSAGPVDLVVRFRDAGWNGHVESGPLRLVRRTDGAWVSAPLD